MGKQLFLGRRPKPALLFLIAEKEGKKASPLGTYKTYFEPGILQLPTVGQVKCLYNSVKNKFYRRLQRGALNGNGKQQGQNNNGKQQRQNDNGHGKNKGEKAQKKYKNTHCLIGRLVGER